MTYAKLSIGAARAEEQRDKTIESETDIWAIFKALRDARSVFGLRPGHIQTLQAMVSFLKPGQGETVFASNNSICERVGGVDERTLRRHINRFVELGFIKRHDSSNRKRYRVRSSNGECISYGLSLAPLVQRSAELFAIARDLEDNKRDRIFVRKQILAKLSTLEEHDAASSFIQQARKALRRKLSLTEYQDLLSEAEAECSHLDKQVNYPQTAIVTANDGQTVRHHSRFKKEVKIIRGSCDSLSPKTLVSACNEAASFANDPLESWIHIEAHARTLAPMMGISPRTFEQAKYVVGSVKASSAIFLMLQFGKSIRNFHAYFHSITLGRRKDRFDPVKLIAQLSSKLAT